MSDITTLKEQAARFGLAEDALYKELNAFFKGKSVRILCPHYNGQIAGSSKPKLKGRVFQVSGATEHRGRIYLGFAEHQDSIELDMVEVLP